jgi:transcriptional regulator GlxA family with amidase domain
MLGSETEVPMKRREFITGSAAMLGAISVGSISTPATTYAQSPIARGVPLEAPKKGKINVAFAIAEGANVIDLAGAWEVFQDVHVGRRMPFRLYTVAATTEPITATGGLQIIPNYSVDEAPRPDLISVGALRSNPALTEWLATASRTTDVTMSVCTGAYQLGKAGLLDGLEATTHHDFYDDFEKTFPDVKVQRGLRFVENEHIATAGGLTSGIDLALRTVERYFGRDVAQTTADYMEYRGTGWQV